MRWLKKEIFRLFLGQRGISLIETVVALALLGIIGVVFLSGLTISSKGVIISQEKVVAESLAKSQIEHIKAQDYIPLADYDPLTNCYEVIDIPNNLVGRGYDVEINPPETIISASEGGFELQSIAVVIKCNGEGVFTILIYRQGVSI